MILFRSIIFTIFIIIWSFFIAIVLTPTLILPSRFILWFNSRFLTIPLKYSAWFICGLKGEIRGLENIPEGACLLASKHQSALETITLNLCVDRLLFVLKKNLVQIPFAGWILHRSGMISVNRKDGARALKKMLVDVKDRLNKGYRVLIFPEGTRVAPGEKGKYNTGIAAMYMNSKVPVVPMALNTGLFWKRYSLIKEPGTYIIEFLPPIQPGLNKKEFMKKLEDTIETATNKLIKESKK